VQEVKQAAHGVRMRSNQARTKAPASRGPPPGTSPRGEAAIISNKSVVGGNKCGHFAWKSGLKGLSRVG
jgi:hypothetical protein